MGKRILKDPIRKYNIHVHSSAKAKIKMLQLQCLTLPIFTDQLPRLCSVGNHESLHAFHKTIPLSQHITPLLVQEARIVTRASLKHEILPNALRRISDPLWRGRFSLGVDLGLSRTGLALSKGFFPRPLMVLHLKGKKLEFRLLEVAEQHEVDEFIIGLPKSQDGRETPQSNKVRSFANKLAIKAAERGWRVFLQNEHGTSAEALGVMIDMGLRRNARREKIDSYAAVVVLERYFSMSGHETELVLPKEPSLQEMLRRGPSPDPDFLPDEQ